MQACTILLIAVSATSPILAEELLKTEPGQAGFSVERPARIHQALKNSVDRKEFAGVNVAIARHGKLAYFESFGFQDLEAGTPMRPDTIFRMASMTKPIATSAVMMLYEEGKFLLDDPVSKFIPGLDKVKALARE